MEKLIEDNKNLIYSIAHYFKNYQSKEDLYQVGCVGLLKAYKNYDPNNNTKFSTYAFSYILGEMRQYVRMDKGIKISREISKLNLKIEKCYILLAQKLMRKPTNKEISEFLGIDEYLIEESLKSANPLMSLDTNINDSELNLYDVISSKEVDMLTLLSLKEELQKLDATSKEIINLRYFNDLTQQEVANILGISQVQVSRNEHKVLRKIRNNIN